jgi:hypothetical protein
MTLAPGSPPPGEPPTPRTARTSRVRRTTAIAAVGAALAGVAVAGTLAGAQQDRPDTRATATQAAVKTSPKVRVLVKRGLRGRTGARGRAGATGPKGSPGAPGQAGAAASDVARSLTINWKGKAFAGRDTATANVPLLGRLDLTCNPDTQELRLTPSRADARTIATVNRFQSATAGHERRVSSGDPIIVPLPVNGMITAVFSVEPSGGDGGGGPAPATLTLSSEIKLNADPGDPGDFNFCYIAAQVLQAG